MHNHRENEHSLKKHLPFFAAGAIFIGFYLGAHEPTIGPVISRYMPIGLFMMVFPQMVNVDLGKVKEAFRGKRQLLITPLYNYLFSPFLIFLLAHIFLPDEPFLQTGLILTGMAPCIGMINAWAGLAGGNMTLSATLSSIDSILQIFLTPFFIALLVKSIPYDHTLIPDLIARYLLLPLIAGNIMRFLVLRSGGKQGLRDLQPLLEKIEYTGIVFTLIIMFSSEGDHIPSNPWHLIRIAVPLVIFYCTRFVIILETCKRLRISYENTVSMSFNGAGINFELAIAIALCAFPSRVAEAAVMCPMMEVPVMLMLARYAESRRQEFMEQNKGKESSDDKASLRRRMMARLMISHWEKR